MDFEESVKTDDKKHNCNQEFNTKDGLKKHKKTEHPDIVKKCEKFSVNKCERKDTHCWYIHQVPELNLSEKKQVFHKDPKDPFPPEVQKMMNTVNLLFQKFQDIEKQLKQIQK